MSISTATDTGRDPTLPHAEILEFEEDSVAKRKNNWLAYASDPDHNPAIDVTPAARWKYHNGQKIPNVGDSIIFNALLSYSGNASARDAITSSQDKTGRFWRSPLHVDSNGNPTHFDGGDGTSFSQDQTLGVLLHLVVHPDRNEARSQAKHWLHYMKSKRSIWDKIDLNDLAPLPPDVQQKIIKSFRKCVKGGPMEDGCVIHEIVERLEWVDKKIKEGVECVRNLKKCFTKAWEPVKKEVAKEIGYWTTDVCDELDTACIIKPSLWFLFHRIWRDHLGLAPSRSMQFADALFLRSEKTYDQFYAATVPKVDDYKLHLVAVNALVRSLLGKPSVLTISAVYAKQPNNPFYQFLMRRYVNPMGITLDRIRLNFMGMAPKEIKKVCSDSDIAVDECSKEKLVWKDENNHPISGMQWAWQRNSPETDVKDTMGWDCVFLADLLTQEYSKTLDEYLVTVFKPLLKVRTMELGVALVPFLKIVKAYEIAEADVVGFIHLAKEIIKNPIATKEEIEGINQSISEKFQALPIYTKKELLLAYQTVFKAHLALLSLMDQSRKEFQNADRIQEFDQIWEKVEDEFAFVEPALQQAWGYFMQDSLSSQLSQLLILVPLRIEQARTEDITSELGRVDKKITDAQKEIAINTQFNRAQIELLAHAHVLASEMSSEVRNSKYSIAKVLASEIPIKFSQGSFRIFSSYSALGNLEKEAITVEAKKLIDEALNYWNDLIRLFNPMEIVQDRLEGINIRAMAVGKIASFVPVNIRRKIIAQWQQKVSEAGYRGSTENPWKFEGPTADAEEEEWLAFDDLLNSLEVAVEDFMLVIQEVKERLRPQLVSMHLTVKEIEGLERFRRTPSPATGVVFSVDAHDPCKKVLSSPTGDKYTLCTIPQHAIFSAAPPSETFGNRVIPELPFLNRVVFYFKGSAVYGGSYKWTILDQWGVAPPGEDHQWSIEPQVPYTGASIEFVADKDLNRANVFSKDTAMGVSVNYVYPELSSLRVYASLLIKYNLNLAKVYKRLTPDADSQKVLIAIDDAVEVFQRVIDRESPGRVTKHFIEESIKKLLAAKLSLSQACNSGDERLCSRRIAETLSIVSEILSHGEEDMDSLKKFLSAEIVRIDALEDTFKEKLIRGLEEILNDFPDSKPVVHTLVNSGSFPMGQSIEFPLLDRGHFPIDFSPISPSIDVSPMSARISDREHLFFIGERITLDFNHAWTHGEPRSNPPLNVEKYDASSQQVKRRWGLYFPEGQYYDYSALTDPSDTFSPFVKWKSFDIGHKNRCSGPLFVAQPNKGKVTARGLLQVVTPDRLAAEIESKERLTIESYLEWGHLTGGNPLSLRFGLAFYDANMQSTGAIISNPRYWFPVGNTVRWDRKFAPSTTGVAQTERIETTVVLSDLRQSGRAQFGHTNIGLGIFFEIEGEPRVQFNCARVTLLNPI